MRFEDVTFGYQQETPVLRNVSFALAQTLGVLGRTGSGKTTIARLLLRLYDPDAGRVLLGDHDLRLARIDELRRRVGMVTQDVQLFRASVRDNLAFFQPTVPDERILKALRQAGLWGWDQRLPKGLDTLLDPAEAGLSAGEAQLLAFARVFLKDPGLVILDEASSRLDSVTEQKVQRSIKTLLHPGAEVPRLGSAPSRLEGSTTRRTGIVIAHRLETVRRVDAILILEGVRVQELGPREALPGDPRSRFSQLLRHGMEEVLS